MQCNRDLLFPTTIHYYDNVLEDKQLNNIIEFLEKQGKEKIKLNETWQSSPDIYNHVKFKTLVKKIMDVSKNYLDEMNWVYSNYEITDMWANVNPPNNFHRPHMHSNNVLSGVFYLKSDQNANIVFADPRPQAHIIEPEITNWQLNNSQNWYYISTVNRLILFPSYLSHHVPVNKSNQNRISISFNIMLKGKVGSSLELQSGNF
mgnify:FL=1